MRDIGKILLINVSVISVEGHWKHEGCKKHKKVSNEVVELSDEEQMPTSSHGWKNMRGTVPFLRHAHWLGLPVIGSGPPMTATVVPTVDPFMDDGDFANDDDFANDEEFADDTGGVETDTLDHAENVVDEQSALMQSNGIASDGGDNKIQGGARGMSGGLYGVQQMIGPPIFINTGNQNPFYRKEDLRDESTNILGGSAAGNLDEQTPLVDDDPYVEDDIGVEEIENSPPLENMLPINLSVVANTFISWVMNNLTNQTEFQAHATAETKPPTTIEPTQPRNLRKSNDGERHHYEKHSKKHLRDSHKITNQPDNRVPPLIEKPHKIPFTDNLQDFPNTERIATDTNAGNNQENAPLVTTASQSTSAALDREDVSLDTQFELSSQNDTHETLVDMPEMPIVKKDELFDFNQIPSLEEVSTLNQILVPLASDETPNIEQELHGALGKDIEFLGEQLDGSLGMDLDGSLAIDLDGTLGMDLDGSLEKQLNGSFVKEVEIPLENEFEDSLEKEVDSSLEELNDSLKKEFEGSPEKLNASFEKKGDGSMEELNGSLGEVEQALGAQVLESDKRGSSPNISNGIEAENPILNIFKEIYNKEIDTLDILKMMNLTSMPLDQREVEIDNLANKYEIDNDTKLQIHQISQNPTEFFSKKSIAFNLSSILGMLTSESAAEEAFHNVEHAAAPPRRLQSFQDGERVADVVHDEKIDVENVDDENIDVENVDVENVEVENVDVEKVDVEKVNVGQVDNGNFSLGELEGNFGVGETNLVGDIGVKDNISQGNLNLTSNHSLSSSLLSRQKDLFLSQEQLLMSNLKSLTDELLSVKASPKARGEGRYEKNSKVDSLLSSGDVSLPLDILDKTNAEDKFLLSFLLSKGIVKTLDLRGAASVDSMGPEVSGIDIGSVLKKNVATLGGELEKTVAFAFDASETIGKGVPIAENVVLGGPLAKLFDSPSLVVSVWKGILPGEDNTTASPTLPVNAEIQKKVKALRRDLEA